MKKILIVVDMQNDFIDGALGTAEAQKIVGNVIEKIKDFDGDVYYTRDTHGEDYLHTQEGKKLPVVHCIEHTEGWQIKPAVLEAGAGKIAAVVNKPTFASAELAERIFEESITLSGDNETQGGMIESITLIGLCTDICVISNAIALKARLWEIPILVDASCCAGVSPKSHENALEAMKMCHITII